MRVQVGGSDAEWVSLRTPFLDPLGYVLVSWLVALPQVFTEAQCPAVRPQVLPSDPSVFFTYSQSVERHLPGCEAGDT